MRGFSSRAVVVSVVVVLSGIFLVAPLADLFADVDGLVLGPEEAWVLETQEGSGGITSHSVVSEVTEKVLRVDEQPVEITEIRNTTGGAIRRQLLVSFDGSKLSNVSGYYIFSFAPVSSRVSGRGSLSIDSVEMRRRGDKLVLNLRVKSNTEVSISTYYSAESPMFAGAWISGPYRGLLNKSPMSDLTEFINDVVGDIPSAQMDSSWHTVSLPIRSVFSKEGWKIAQADNLFRRLCEEFSQDGESTLWVEAKLDTKKIERLVAGLRDELTYDGYQYTFNVAILYNENQIVVGHRVLSDLRRGVEIETQDGLSIGRVDVSLERLP